MRRYLLFLVVFWLLGCGASPKLVWKFPTNSRIHGSPLVVGDRLFVGNLEGLVFALDSRDGKVLWKKQVGSAVFSKLVAIANQIIVFTGNGEVMALNPASGEMVWSFPTGAAIDFSACQENEAFYFGNNAGHFFKLSTKGQKIWEAQAGYKFSGSCGIFQNAVYASSWDQNFYAFASSDGHMIWKQSSGIINFAGPTIENGVVYFASHTHLFGFDAATGDKKYQIETPYLNYVLPWNHFLWTNETGLTKRNLNGTEVASVKFNSLAGSPPVVDQNGLFLVAAGKNLLYGVGPDLKVRWKFTGGDIFSGGMIQDRIYYTGNLDGYVYAIRLPE